MGDRKFQNLGRVALVLNRDWLYWKGDGRSIHDMMIYFWSSEMFLYDADMSYVSYSAYILNILYIALL